MKKIPRIRTCQRCGRVIPRLDYWKYCSRACYRPLTTEQRFWLKVGKTETCWLWFGKLAHFGHGLFNPTHRNQQRAHRFAWELANGPIPDGLFVLHRCDNPGCVRVDHLFLGTQADNMRDMCKKGRQQTTPGLIPMTAERVLQIRAATGRPCEIAKALGATRANVNAIRARKSWAWLK